MMVVDYRAWRSSATAIILPIRPCQGGGEYIDQRPPEEMP